MIAWEKKIQVLECFLKNFKKTTMKFLVMVNLVVLKYLFLVSTLNKINS